MERVLQFPTIWVPRGFNREKRVHESRIGTPGAMTGGMQSLSGVETGLYGPNGPAGTPVFWYKSDTQTYQDSGFVTPATANNDPVGGWKDQSGNSRDILQATSGRRGLLLTNQINGYPGVKFDAASTQFKSLAMGASVYTLNMPFTFFGVVKQTAWKQSYGLWMDENNGSPQCLQDGSTPNIDMYTDAVHSGALTSFTIDTWAILEWVGSATIGASMIKKNNDSPVTGTLTNAAILQFLLGDFNGTTGAGLGSVWAEFIAYDSDLSDANSTITRNYLNAKYVIF